MSAHNGERARFNRNRKRRLVQRMRLRTLLLALKQQAAAAAPQGGHRLGPALAGA